MCSWMRLAAAYDRQRLHHEGDVILEVEEIPWHVRVFHVAQEVLLMARL